MPTAQVMRHCGTCKKQTVHLHPEPNHILHLILTLMTCSAWGIVWLWLSFFSNDYQCTQCGNKPGILAQIGLLQGLGLILLFFIVFGIFFSFRTTENTVNTSLSSPSQSLSTRERPAPLSKDEYEKRIYETATKFEKLRASITPLPERSTQTWWATLPLEERNNVQSELSSEIIPVIEELTLTNPERPEAFQVLGDLYLFTDNFSESNQYYLKAYHLGNNTDENNAKLLWRISSNYCSLHNQKKSDEFAKLGLQLYPKNIDFKDQLEYIKSGFCVSIDYAYKKAFESALQEIQEEKKGSDRRPKFRAS